jgi:hypothetical protein
LIEGVNFFPQKHKKHLNIIYSMVCTSTKHKNRTQLQALLGAAIVIAALVYHQGGLEFLPFSVEAKH